MDYQILVNKNHKIPSDYIDKVQFVEVECTDGGSCKIEKSAYHHFCQLVEHFLKQNISIRVSSGYRSIEEQEQLFLESVKNEGIEYTTKFVSKPYYSEHHTGLAIDIDIWRDGEKELLQDESIKEEILKKKAFEYAKIHQVLRRYGFILRYPRGKEEITGYSYEPWHIRYVGPLAKKMLKEETLEEYYSKQIQK